MEKKKKVLFIGSTNLKHKTLLDGETIKSQYILDILKERYYVKNVNLSHHKLFGTLKIIFFSIFRKFDYYVISKSPQGANIILKILRRARVNSNKIFYCLIGASLWMYFRDNDKRVKIENIKYTNAIVVETSLIKERLSDYGINNVVVLPNFKPSYDLPYVEKKYPKEILKVCFLSRLVEGKGIVELMSAIKEINVNGVKYQLDIYGVGDEDFVKKIKALTDDNIVFYGGTTVKSKDDYEHLSHYDLHCFPTKFSCEGMPGSIIDFYIAGVPTLSSRYYQHQELIDDDCAFLYEFDNDQALKDELIYIYEHQEEITKKREEVISRAYKFTLDTFKHELFRILEGEQNGKK